MINIILAIITVAGFMGIITGYSKLIGKRNEQQMIEAQKEAYKQALEESKIAHEEVQASKDVEALEFDSWKEFYVEDVPNLSDGSHSFIDILLAYDDYYENKPEEYEEEIAEWLRPALNKLEGQCDSIEFAINDIQRMTNLLREKDFDSFAKLSITGAQEVINTFDSNRTEALDLINQLYFTDNKQLIKKLKATLLCLARDNDEIIDGLDTFRNSLRRILSQVCEDEHPEHITDFTSLHRLLEIPVMVDRVMNSLETEEKPEAESTVEVPTIEMPKEKRTFDYFKNLSLGDNTSKTKPEEHNTGGIFYGECGVD